MNFTNIFINEYKLIIPELFLIFAILILLIYGVVYSSLKNTQTSTFILKNYSNIPQNNPILTKNISWLSVYILSLFILLVNNNTISSSIGFNQMFIFDDFTNIAKIIIAISAIITFVVSLDYIKSTHNNIFEYNLLILLSTLGMIGIISSNDLITMYLSIEMQSLCLYVLATSNKDSAFSTEAGLKYFMLGAVSSGLLLFGSALVYGFTGTTNFIKLANLFCVFDTTLYNLPQINAYVSSGLLVGITFIAAGLLFKLTAFPFHAWAPDVYEGTPTNITTFFVITPKIAIFAVFLRLFIFVFYNLIGSWQQILIFCSMGSLILGAFAALPQKKFKRLLAYSSISHVGFMLMGFSTGTVEGVQGLLVYIIAYIIMGINVWTIILALEKHSMTSKIIRLNYLTDLSMLSNINPLFAFTLSIAIFSLAGIPPLMGFFAKLYVLYATINVSMYVLPLIGVLTSVIGAFYYIRFVKILYFENKNRFYFHKTMDREKSLILGITFFIIILFFIYPTPIFLLTHKMALIICL